MGFCFVHAADLHLDTPFEGLARSSDEVAERLRDASLGAFDDLVALALDREAAFVVLAGDLYDGVARGVRAELRFLRGVSRLSQAGIPVFAVHGNHDPIGGWPGVRTWPEGVTFFGAQRVEVVPVVRDGVTLAQVYGISFGRREVTENLALRFARREGPGLHVGVLHCNVGGDPAHESHAPCSLDDLVRSGLDYWALGHVHRRRVLRETRPCVVYPGNPQGRSPKPSERGEKGCFVVHVGDDGDVVRIEPVALDRVRFIGLEIEVSGLADLGALRSLLAAEAAALVAGGEGRTMLVRCSLRGRGPVHRDLQCLGGADELLRDLRDDSSEGSLLWWESLRDETLPDLDLDAIRARGDLASELVRRVDGLVADEPALTRFFHTRVRQAGPAKAQRHLSDEPAEARRVAREALTLVLELLEQGSDACG